MDNPNNYVKYHGQLYFYFDLMFLGARKLLKSSNISLTEHIKSVGYVIADKRFWDICFVLFVLSVFQFAKKLHYFYGTFEYKSIWSNLTT